MSRFIETLKDRGLVAPLIVAAVLSVVGLAVWAAELAGMTGVIGTNDATPWGAYLMVFIFFVGLGAGSALISALGSVFHVKACEPYVAPGLVMGIAFVAVAGLAIIMDLGNPANIMAMLLGLNLRSVLAWDMIFLTLFLVVTVVAFVSAVRSGGKERISRGMGIAVLVAAVLLLCIDALLFQAESAREAWHSALLVPWFFATAIASALALMVIVGAFGAQHDGTLAESFAPLEKLLMAFACLDLAFLLFDVLHGVVSSNALDAAVPHAMLAGQLAPYFWTQVVLYAAAIALLAVPADKAPSWSRPVAAVLVLLGVFAKRIDFILGGFFAPMITYPQAEGLVQYAEGVSYAPAWSELVICLGFFAMVAFLAIAGIVLAAKEDQKK